MLNRIKAFFLFTCFSHATCVFHTTFCMATARRNVSYLDQVIQSYKDQGVMHMDGAALVVLDVDNSTMGREEPLKMRQQAVCDSVDTEGLPSCQVRQQGLDVAAALEQCSNFTSAWVVLVEDDCKACSGALNEVVSTLSRLDASEIAMAKFSKFVRATAFAVSIVASYVKSIRERLYTFPYDVTVMEQWAPGRTQYIHARNLFHHVGHVSTESKRNEETYRTKYAALRSDVCFEIL